MCIMCVHVHVHVHVYVYKTADQHLNFSFLSNLLPPSEGNTEEAALSTPLTPAVSFPAATFPPLLLAVGSQVAQWFHQLHAEITLLLMCNSRTCHFTSRCSAVLRTCPYPLGRLQPPAGLPLSTTGKKIAILGFPSLTALPQ